MAKSLYLLALAFIASSEVVYGIEEWTIGNFTKQDAVNPVMGPRDNTTFFCPVRQEIVNWEKKDVFNPTALVRDGKIHMLYRAEDEVGAFKGTSRIGLAVSTDGFTFEREEEPIFYPDNDDANIYEWEGGCEDPRIVELNGTYYLTYTGYDGELARLMVATSFDLRNWTKHGLVFGKANNGSYENMWSKSGAVVTTLQDEKFVATQINGKFWMYFGESNIYAATSEDLINWTPVVDPNEESEDEYKLLPIFGPREGRFDSDIVEPGPQAIIREEGIVLIYNSRNKNPNSGGDPELPLGTYSAGQVLLNVTSPTQLIGRTENYFITPDRDYEIIGQVNNVVFVEGLVNYKNKWHLYYGTADSKIALAVIE
ncbi:Beta-1,4-mannooligosaccharide phosphorylase [Orchesella cincta]|uniref:Beta-1,4-mannooligosaccharide phosphorylase n=1 Tax=Orchesella cincta TaxID=48709 RepID=A0A1D2MFE3_ORCCI|nr:Beta-1,4-mannooligosaccharide phosphorylase [Orchesella cincta]